jgi:hypothetical protein
MIEFALDEHIALLTLSRPPANAFTAEGLQQLQDLIAKIDANPEVRAVVITGAGDRFFSAGADLNGFAEGDRGHARVMAQRFGSAFEALPQSTAMPWVAGWNARSPAMCASPRSRRRWHCPKPPWGCCHAAVARKPCRGWSAKAGPSG